MATKTETVPPLALVQRYTAEYPGIWDRIDLLRAATMAGEIDAAWDFSICWCPVAAAIGALDGYRGAEAKKRGDAGFVAACAAWRRTKMVYRFDPDLAGELLAMADDVVIPVEILRSLPAQALYIQFDEPGGEGDTRVDGFLVHIEDDVNTREKELRIDYLSPEGKPVLPVFVHLMPGGTISDGIRAAETTALKNMDQMPGGYLLKENTIDLIRASTQSAMEAVQLILYICAENAEIEENEAQAKIYRKSDRIVDRFRELRKWDVGVKTGVILRAAEKRDREDAKEAETGRDYNRVHKARPHVRRAHWHHYWTGSGDSKKLILRWVNTVLVNADDGELPPTVIPLK